MLWTEGKCSVATVNAYRYETRRRRATFTKLYEQTLLRQSGANLSDTVGCIVISFTHLGIQYFIKSSFNNCEESMHSNGLLKIIQYILTNILHAAPVRIQPLSIASTYVQQTYASVNSALESKFNSARLGVTTATSTHTTHI